MIEPKVRLSLLVPGANMLSSQECEKNPKKSYNEHKLLIEYTKGKSKKKYKELLSIKTRKSRLVTHVINISKEAYDYMLDTPTSFKLSKLVVNKKGCCTRRVWDNMSINERLRSHFDIIAHDFHTESYSYEILDD